jgi:hypothetical protein
VLTDMRAALGGDAIAGVRAFAVEGKQSRNIGQFIATSHAEWVYVSPDRFIHVRRFEGRFSQLVDTNGFNGNRLVRLTAASGNVRGGPFEPPPQSPEEHAASLRASVTNEKRQFARYAIAMLGMTTAYPLDAADAGTEILEGKSAHVLALKAADGYESRLYVDVSTHLPLMISWMDGPDVIVGRTSTMTTKDGRVVASEADPARKPPPGAVAFPDVPTSDAIASLPLVERRIYYSDYKKTDGLNWPHRFREVVAGATIGDTRLGKFKINPPVDPSRFVTAR